MQPQQTVGTIATALVGIIRAYQKYISPALPQACRYTPTCSEYTILALEKFGAAQGLWVGFKRLLRCHPFHPGGFDPLP